MKSVELGHLDPASGAGLAVQVQVKVRADLPAHGQRQADVVELGLHVELVGGAHLGEWRRHGEAQAGLRGATGRRVVPAGQRVVHQHQGVYLGQVGAIQHVGRGEARDRLVGRHVAGQVGEELAAAGVEGRLARIRPGRLPAELDVHAVHARRRALQPHPVAGRLRRVHVYGHAGLQVDEALVEVLVHHLPLASAAVLVAQPLDEHRRRGAGREALEVGEGHAGGEAGVVHPLQRPQHVELEGRVATRARRHQISRQVRLGGEPGVRVGCRGAAGVGEHPAVVYVAHAPGEWQRAAGRRPQARLHLGVDQPLVAVNVRLLQVRVEGVVGRQVAHPHLVVQAHTGVQPNRVGHPVAQSTGDGVVDGVPHGAPLLRVRTGARRRLVVGADDGEPGQARVGVLLDAAHARDDRGVATVVELAGRQHGEGEGAVLQHAVQVGRPGPAAAEAFEEVHERLRLGLGGRGVRPEGVAAGRPVAVHVHAVAVVALVHQATLAHVAAPPAVRVGLEEPQLGSGQRLAHCQGAVGQRLQQAAARLAAVLGLLASCCSP